MLSLKENKSSDKLHFVHVLYARILVVKKLGKLQKKQHILSSGNKKTTL
jgi:hypothetical protein